ncbi:MAG: hypothetical protein WAN60_20240 [Candidatus Sulfotelmatobacter sp.]
MDTQTLYVLVSGSDIANQRRQMRRKIGPTVQSRHWTEKMQHPLRPSRPFFAIFAVKSFKGPKALKLIT